MHTAIYRSGTIYSIMSCRSGNKNRTIDVHPDLLCKSCSSGNINFVHKHFCPQICRPNILVKNREPELNGVFDYLDPELHI